MEIAYSKHIPNDEYFIINKINGVFSPNIDIISSNLYDIKRIDYKGKMLVYLFFKINGLTNEKEINNALKHLNLKSNILRANGWNILTAINMMLFTVLHFPCRRKCFAVFFMPALC